MHLNHRDPNVPKPRSRLHPLPTTPSIPPRGNHSHPSPTERHPPQTSRHQILRSSKPTSPLIQSDHASSIDPLPHNLHNATLDASEPFPSSPSSGSHPVLPPYHRQPPHPPTAEKTPHLLGALMAYHKRLTRLASPFRVNRCFASLWV